MILQLTAKSTGVQNLIRTNTHIPYCDAADSTNKNVLLYLILELDLRKQEDQLNSPAKRRLQNLYGRGLAEW